LNILVFFFEVSLHEDDLHNLIMSLGVVPARYTDLLVNRQWDVGALWLLIPLLSNMFLHGGLAHIIGNMWSLWIFGDNVEDRMGRWNYLCFYLLCGLLASITHIVSAPASTVPAIGASGAISGVMGAYMFLYPHSQIIFFVPILFIWFIQLPAFIYLGFWFFTQFMSGTSSMDSMSGGIAFWAHIGGFVAGALLFRFFLWEKKRKIYADEYYRNYL
jgi:membrane associated rhomboid family serine protease